MFSFGVDVEAYHIAIFGNPAHDATELESCILDGLEKGSQFTTRDSLVHAMTDDPSGGNNPFR